MSLPVRLSAGAQHDVEDTVQWYEGQRLDSEGVSSRHSIG